MTSTIGTLMQDRQYLAQVGHFFGASWLMLVYGIFTREWHMVAAFAVGAVVAGLKEFVYDLSSWGEGDSLGDSAMDFAFYLLGGTVGVWLSHLAFAHHFCVMT